MTALFLYSCKITGFVLSLSTNTAQPSTCILNLTTFTASVQDSSSSLSPALLSQSLLPILSKVIIETCKLDHVTPTFNSWLPSVLLIRTSEVLTIGPCSLMIPPVSQTLGYLSFLSAHWHWPPGCSSNIPSTLLLRKLILIFSLGLYTLSAFQRECPEDPLWNSGLTAALSLSLWFPHQMWQVYMMLYPWWVEQCQVFLSRHSRFIEWDN